MCACFGVRGKANSTWKEFNFAKFCATVDSVLYHSVNVQYHFVNVLCLMLL
jgi:hypothetical protein